MDYYDELCVRRDATPEEIRRSYRSLARLLHPDQCTDENLRRLAGTQMQRLNHVLSILIDPQQRSRYDAALDRPAPIARLGRGPRVRYWPWCAAGAVALSGALIYLTGGDHTLATPQPAGTYAAAPELPSVPPAAPNTAAALQTVRRELERLRAEHRRLLDRLALAGSPAAVPLQPIPEPRMPSRERAPLAAGTLAPDLWRPMPLPAPEAPTAPHSEPAAARHSESAGTRHGEPAATRPASSLAGTWYFVPATPQKPSRGLYPPEYIELKLSEDGGLLRGRYWGRYHVADQAISPEVVFRFEGASDGPAARLPWTGPHDARGQITLHLASEDTLEVSWTASRLSPELNLASGTATLIRQRQ